mmetsp:Transcript_4474/g.11458  ORF Transcript_4474/g.11458 Transcript_4474/m.11458 type:complete len:219 (-) Transcript_4474:395-1051(-)
MSTGRNNTRVSASAGGGSCREALDSSSAASTSTSLASTFSAASAAGRTSFATPSGGNGLTSAAAHHESSAGDSGCGPIPSSTERSASICPSERSHPPARTSAIHSCAALATSTARALARAVEPSAWQSGGSFTYSTTPRMMPGAPRASVGSCQRLQILKRRIALACTSSRPSKVRCVSAKTQATPYRAPTPTIPKKRSASGRSPRAKSRRNNAKYRGS